MNFYFWFSVTQMYFSLVIKLKIFFKKKKKNHFPTRSFMSFSGKAKKKKKKNLKITITKQLLTLLIPFMIELKVSSPITPPLDYLEKQKGNFWWCWILQRCIAASTTLMIEIAGPFFYSPHNCNGATLCLRVNSHSQWPSSFGSIFKIQHAVIF